MRDYIDDLVARMSDVSHRELNPPPPSTEWISWKATREAEKLADEKYVPVLIEFIEKEKVNRVKGEAYFVLAKVAGNTGSGEAVRFLVSRFGKEKVRYLNEEILDLLAKLRKPVGVDWASVIEATGSPVERIRHSAIKALSYSCDPVVEDRLLELVDGAVGEGEGILAIGVLASSGSERSIPRLQELVDHAPEGMSVLAETSIVNIRKRMPGAELLVPPSEMRLSALLAKVNAEPLPEPCGRQPGDAGRACMSAAHWVEYELYETGVSVPLKQLPRREAKRVFEQYVDTREDRVERLARLARGCGVELGVTDEAVQRLNDWFRAHIEPHPDVPGEIDAKWRSIVHDVTMFLAEVLFEHYPNLHWELDVWGKRFVNYHKPVLKGFSTSSPRSTFGYDFEGLILGHAYRVIHARGSIPPSQIVEVRGVKIDLNDTIEKDSEEEDVGYFLEILGTISRKEQSPGCLPASG